jgi:predicted metal-binding membrane protein
MSAPAPYPLARERNVILAALLILAGAAWLVIVWQARAMQPMGLTMGMNAPLFISIWIVMMIAMMFPTAAPMVLMFDTIAAGKRSQGQAFVPSWIFVSAYLLIWTIFGVAAYAAASALDAWAAEAMLPMDVAARAGGIVLVAAGLYQFSPLKRACLAKCRSPLSFVLSSWRDGYSGAFRMGLEHGAYCLGCCWLLFVILFPLGVMNVAVMAVLTVLILAEKSLAIGPRLAQLAAVVLILGGLLVVVLPGVLQMS